MKAQGAITRLGVHQAAIVTLLSFVCFACAGVTIAEPEEESSAKSFRVGSGESNISVFRNEDVVLNTGVSIEVDGQSLGNTVPKTFLLATVPPGNHTMVANGENTVKIDVATEAGKNCFVWLEVGLGAFTNRGHLHLVGEDVGKKGVMESRLAK